MMEMLQFNFSGVVRAHPRLLPGGVRRQGHISVQLGHRAVQVGGAIQIYFTGNDYYLFF